MAELAKKFSVHPKLAAVIDFILNAATLVWLPQIGNWQWLSAWFLARAVIWGLFIRLVYYPPELKRWRHFFSLIFFNFGVIVSLVIFIEWNVAWYLLTGIFVLFSAVSFWLLPSGESNLSFYLKPYRRWLFLMDVFGLTGFWCGIFALMSFQLVPQKMFALMALLGATVSSAVSIWWWRAYGLEFSRRFWLSALSCFILVFELGWIVWRWPVGFLVGGTIVIWFWYNLWLILRFNLSKEGIDWKKQRMFFIIDLILLVIFLFLVKWK
ncbi:MAG: hypothetical protein NTW66_04555 [Candidatus Magasanikbacteria bacterium]|nr:hypothetical protein [Candidatus Magasanikbacteria bacterium]